MDNKPKKKETSDNASTMVEAGNEASEDGNQDVALLRDAAHEAGRIAMEFFGELQDHQVWHKGGNSPVSQADMAVNQYLRERLLDERPGYGWLSEETAEDDAEKKAREQSRQLFVVDPIDGTRGFINGSEQWCIAIAVVTSGRPVSAVLECPALGRTFHALEDHGSFLNGARLSSSQETPSANKKVSVTGSRKLNADLQEKHTDHFDIVPFVPSLAYRLAMVANGELDAAFARSGAHDWDLAAADLILAESGCLITGLDAQLVQYNTGNVRAGALVAASRHQHPSILDIAKDRKFLH